MTNNYKKAFDFCLRCGYTEENIKKYLSDDGKVWNSWFDCSYKNLTSLKGCLKQINGDFDCSDNNLTNLKRAPEIVNGWFDCSNNKLTSLKGTPKFINGDIHL